MVAAMGAILAATLRTALADQPELIEMANAVMDPKQRDGVPPEVADQVRTVLDLEEFSVELAEDGDTALALVRELQPDAVVLDQRMPGQTGLEVLAAMRDDAATADVPVILLTGVESGELPADPVDAGALAHLEKPFSPLHLLEVLHDLLGGV